MKKVLKLSISLILILAIILPGTVFGVSTNSKKKFSDEQKFKFVVNGYELASYSSYNKETRKIEQNLQIKNRSNNKVNIFKPENYKLEVAVQNEFSLYDVEIPGFGRFTIKVDKNNSILESAFTSFSNASASKILNNNDVDILMPFSQFNNTLPNNNLQTFSQVITNTNNSESGTAGLPDDYVPQPAPEPTSTHIKVMILGDSNAQPLLPGVPYSGQPYYIQDRGFINWGDVLANKVAHEGIIIETYNLSVGATTVSDQNTLNTYGDPNINGTPFLTQAKLNEIATYGHVDYLIIALGTNDIIEKIGDGNEGTGIFINSLINFISQVALTIQFDKLIIVEPPMIRPTTLSDGTVVYTPEQAQMVNDYSQAIYDMMLFNTQYNGLADWYGFRDERVVTKWMIVDNDINWDGVHLLNSGETKLGNYMFQTLNLIPDTEIHGGLGGAN